MKQLIALIIIVVLCAVAIYFVMKWTAIPPTPPHRPVTFGPDCPPVCGG